MKTIIFLIATVLIVGNSIAQTSVHVDENSSTVTYSSSDNGENSSISVKESNSVYKLRASYDAKYHDNIFKLLYKELGEANQRNGDRFNWEKSKGNETIYECDLAEGNIRLYLDKDQLSNKEFEKLKDLAEKITDKIGGGSYSYNSHGVKIEIEKSEEKSLEKAEKELELAKKELERALKEVEKAKRKEQ